MIEMVSVVTAFERLVQDVREDGFSFVPHFEVGTKTATIASRIGPVVDLATLLPGAGLFPIQSLRPHDAASSLPNRYSSVFGLGDFPLHTDLAHWGVPPRYLLLRCEVGTPDVVTLVLPYIEVPFISDIDIGKALVRPRHPVRGHSTLLRMGFNASGKSGFRWDPLFLQPANSAAQKAAMLLESKSARARAIGMTLKGEGDTLLLDNWRVLHARGSVDTNGLNRVIERAYIEDE